MLRDQTASACFLCGSANLVERSYLNMFSGNLRRDAAYLLPSSAGALLSALSARFAELYRPVAINRKYFSRTAVYCTSCRTGRCEPCFGADTLSEYYRTFYWTHRNAVDGAHLPTNNRPNETQLSRARERIQWVFRNSPVASSVIDFGAGDCAAAFVFRNEFGISDVHVVDPSQRAAELAIAYGMTASQSVAGVRRADLLFGAHSIEHVHDLHETIRALVSAVPPGGYLFFETPNVATPDLFLRLTLTPHTFTLSADTFRHFTRKYPLELVAMEACGPEWETMGRAVASNVQADLRVLLRRTH